MDDCITARARKRPAAEREITRTDWLESFHSFPVHPGRGSDPPGFRSLLAIAEHRLAPGSGFADRPHRDVELITLIVAGTLAYADSLGNCRLLRAGEVQSISAGSGVMHSEFNASESKPLHILQISIRPREKGGEPAYAHLFPRPTVNALLPLAGPQIAPLPLRQDAWLLLGHVGPGSSVTHDTRVGRGIWIHVISGTIRVAAQELSTGDGFAAEGLPHIGVTGTTDASFLIADVS